MNFFTNVNIHPIDFNHKTATLVAWSRCLLLEFQGSCYPTGQKVRLNLRTDVVFIKHSTVLTLVKMTGCFGTRSLWMA